MTEPVIRTATVGLKEGDTSFNSLMSGIFAPIPRKRAKELGLSELEERSYVKRISTDIDSSGSVDKVALGGYLFYSYDSRCTDQNCSCYAQAALNIIQT